MTFASPEAVAALHESMPRLRIMAQVYAKRRCWLDADDLFQTACIAFCQYYDQGDPTIGTKAGYGRYKAEWEIKSAVRTERRWWNKRTRLQAGRPGWASMQERPDVALRIDMDRTNDWKPLMGWPHEEETDWSDWQQSNHRLFQRGW